MKLYISLHTLYTQIVYKLMYFITLRNIIKLFQSQEIEIIIYFYLVNLKMYEACLFSFIMWSFSFQLLIFTIIETYPFYDPLLIGSCRADSFHRKSISQKNP